MHDAPVRGCLAHLNKANDLRPNDADTLVWRGTAKGSLEDWTGAIADYDAAEQHSGLEEHVVAKRVYAKLMLGTLTPEEVRKEQGKVKKEQGKDKQEQGSWFKDQV